MPDPTLAPTRYAVLGCGAIGRRHASLIALRGDSRLVALADIRPRALCVGADFAEVPYFGSLAQLLAEGPDFDVLCVCTPNGLHAEHCLAALAAHKHVVCEKPMALRRADCEAMIHKSLQVSRHVFCVMQNRYSPPAQWLKQLLAEGRLGALQSVQINCYWNRGDDYYAQSDWKGRLALDGGVLFTQFSHFVDMMYWLFGDIEAIGAQFHNFGHRHNTEFEDSGMVHFRFVGGGLGCFNFSTAVWGQNMESSLSVVGSRGSVKVGGQYMNEVEYCHVAGYEMPELPAAQPANDYGRYKGSAANHAFVFDNVRAVLAGQQAISTNALEGMKVVEIIERIYALRELGGLGLKSP